MPSRRRGGGFLTRKVKEKPPEAGLAILLPVCSDLYCCGHALPLRGSSGVGVEVKGTCKLCGFGLLKLQRRNGDGEGPFLSKPKPRVPIDLHTGRPVGPGIFFFLTGASQWLIASSRQALGGLLAHLSKSLRTMEIQSLWEKLVTCWDEPF